MREHGVTVRGILAAGVTIAAGLLVLVLVAGGVILRGAISALTPGPSRSPAPVSVPVSNPSSLAAPGPLSPLPAVQPSSEPTAQPTFWPSQDPSPGPVAGAPITTIDRDGVTTSGTVRWALQLPLVSTPGSDSGGEIAQDVQSVMDSRLADYVATWDTSDGREIIAEAGMSGVDLRAAFTTYAYVSAGAGSPGFVTFRLDYWYDAPYADAGPQYVDMVSYELNGDETSLVSQFTNPAAALQLLSKATPRYLTGIGDLYPQYYQPTAANFSMWAPLPGGLMVKFPASRIAMAAAGSPSFVLPWAQLRNLVKRGSYLAWYLRGLE